MKITRSTTPAVLIHNDKSTINLVRNRPPMMDDAREETSVSPCSPGPSETHMMPGEHLYDGVLYSANFPVEVLDRVKQFDYRDDDVILASYPKSGTTWMTKIMKILKQIPAGSQRDACFKYIEMDISQFGGNGPFIDYIGSLTTNRTYKTHLGVDFFKKPLEQRKTKFVVVMRNPKDTLVSYYHFYRANPSLGKFKGTFQDFMEMVKSNRVRNWFDWILGWWQYKDHPNVIFFKYADMKSNLENEIHRLAKFLGVPINAEVMEEIQRETSFSAMSYEIARNPLLGAALDPKISVFMRKGTVGDWKNYFTPDMNQYIDRLYNNKIVPVELEFQFEPKD